MSRDLLTVGNSEIKRRQKAERVAREKAEKEAKKVICIGKVCEYFFFN